MKKPYLIELKEIPELEGLGDSDKYGYKAMLAEILKEYPDLLKSRSESETK